MSDPRPSRSSTNQKSFRVEMNMKCFFVVYTGAEGPEANIAEIRTRASSKFEPNSQISSEIANQLEINIRP
jgi:hypothetical protein